MDDRFAVAILSEQGWGDESIVSAFGEGASLGLYGNWKKDDEERYGSLGVVACADKGAGRIIVCGDQNIFGDVFIRYEDNYKLWLNIFGYLLDDPALYRYELFEDWYGPRIVCLEDPVWGSFGNPDFEGLFHFYVHLCREHWAFASVQYRTCQFLIVTGDCFSMDVHRQNCIVQHLKTGLSCLFLYTLHDSSKCSFPMLIDSEDSLVSFLHENLGIQSIVESSFPCSGYLTFDSLPHAKLFYLPSKSFQNKFFTNPESPLNDASAACFLQFQLIFDSLFRNSKESN